MKKNCEMLSSSQLVEVLAQAAADRRQATMSYLSGGKWHVLDVRICFSSEQVLHVETDAEGSSSVAYIQIDHPVGISFERDYCKYVFETSVMGYHTGVNEGMQGRVILWRPDRIEKVRRRAFFRAAVPEDLHVRTLFWHRGYTDNNMEVPAENYWEGRMLDLSAGGMQVEVASAQKECFKQGQLIGLQFTPMPYSKPVLVEGLIAHVSEEWDETIRLGVEFLGLEASQEGREMLRRIVEIVEEYRDAGSERECGPVAAVEENA